MRPVTRYEKSVTVRTVTYFTMCKNGCENILREEVMGERRRKWLRSNKGRRYFTEPDPIVRKVKQGFSNGAMLKDVLSRGGRQ